MKTFYSSAGGIGIFLVLQSIDPLGFSDVSYYFRAIGAGLITVFLGAALDGRES